jgi:hypothetical protein
MKRFTNAMLPSLGSVPLAANSFMSMPSDRFVNTGQLTKRIESKKDPHGRGPKS